MEITSVRMPATNALDAIAESAFGSAKKSEPADGGGFGGMLAKSLAAVDGAQAKAETLSHQYQLGQGDVSLEDAMVAMQKANIGLQATIQVRNRLVAAYNDVMNMQV